MKKRHTTPLEAPENEAVPYFDEEATVLAQPVVPLDSDGDERPSTEYAPEPVPESAPFFVTRERTRTGPSVGGTLRRLPLALLLLSVLTGVVIGGIGFYLFQKQQRPEAGTASAEQSAAPAAEPAAETPTPSETAAAQVAPPAPDEGVPAEVAPAGGGKAEASVVTTPPAAETARRETKPEKGNADAARTAEPKRGKRGEGEDGAARRDDGRNDAARARRESDAAPRRVETIVYPRPRRAERRAERRERRAVDSVRGIFEGRP